MNRTIIKTILTLLLLGLILAPFAGLAPLLIIALITVVAWNVASLLSDRPEDISS